MNVRKNSKVFVPVLSANALQYNTHEIHIDPVLVSLFKTKRTCPKIPLNPHLYVYNIISKRVKFQNSFTLTWRKNTGTLFWDD